MKKVFLTILFLIPIFTLSVNAQNQTISGKIFDQESQELLFGATVAFKNLAEGSTQNLGTISDFDGNYTFSLEKGTYLMTVSYVGYEDFSQELVVDGNAQTIDIQLTESGNILNTATVTSGKYEKPLGEVTVSLEVIKPSLIENTNQNSLSGVLDKVPGVTMVGSQANIRGGSGFSYGAGSRVLLLIDDMPILQADAGFPQWSDVPMENLEQIEVVKGAASALYGSSALNGIINARTAYAKAKPETKIAPFFTYFDDPQDKSQIWWDEQPTRFGTAISHKQKFGKFDLVAGGYYINGENSNERSGTERGRINFNTRYRITDQLTVGLNSNFNKSKGSSFFYWAGNGENLRRGDERTFSESESFRYNIDPYVTYFDNSNGRHKLQSRFMRVGNNNDAESDQSNKSNVNYFEYQYQKNIEPFDLVASTGLVYTKSAVKAPLYGDTTLYQKNIAAYLQLDKKIGDRLNISGGFRYERNRVETPEIFNYELIRDNGSTLTFTDTIPNGEIIESRPVFRLGLNYKITEGTFFRASWGQGYRFPTIAEKFIFTTFGGVPINPNFDLQSETGWSGEVGFKQGFKVDKAQGFVDLAFFWSEYDNMMEFVFEGLAGFQSQNIGDTKIRGIEISVGGQGKLFGLPVSILGGYTFLDPKYKEFDFFAESGTEARFNALHSSICNDPEDPNKENCVNILKYRSKHSAKIDLETEIKKWTVGLSAIYNSNIENIDAEFEAFIVPGLRDWRKENDNGYVDFGARVAYQIIDIMKISLIGNNLLNIDYSSRPGQLTGTRNITARMDFKF